MQLPPQGSSYDQRRLTEAMQSLAQILQGTGDIALNFDMIRKASSSTNTLTALASAEEHLESTREYVERREQVCRSVKTNHSELKRNASDKAEVVYNSGRSEWLDAVEI